MQSYTAFLKLFSVTGFIILILEVSQYYDFYRVQGANHLEILKVTTFSWFLILPIVLGLAGASVVAANLIRRAGLIDTLFKDMVQVICATILGLAFVRSLMAGLARYYHLPDSPFHLIYENYWQGYRVIPLGVIVVLLYMQRSGALKQWFNNVVELLWIPYLSLSLGALIWIGPSFITFSIAELTQSVEANGNKPNVFLITFDALSARDMSLYGYRRKTTPYLDEFAKESFVFEKMHSNYPSTSIALTSILTGKYPWTHGAQDSDNLTIDLHGALSLKIESIATALKEYCTVAVVNVGRDIGVKTQFDYIEWPAAQGNLGSFFNKVCSNGFRPALLPLPGAPLIFGSGGERRPPFVEAMRYLKRLKQRPFLMWIHVWPPHAPYLPPLAFKGTFLSGEEDFSRYYDKNDGSYKESEQPIVDKLRARYDEFILYADDCLHSFVESLKERGLYDNSLIIITSDHGESFEKGYLYHGGSNSNLYEPEIHIPLLIHLPGQSYGSRTSVLAEQVDLAPTIFDVLGKPIPYWMEGKSLLPYMSGKKSNDNKATYSKSGETIAVFKGDYKFVQHSDGTERLYNLRKDPEELENLLLKGPDVAAQLRERLICKLKTREVAN